MASEVFADARSADVINRMFVPVRVEDVTHEMGQNPPEVAALQSRYKVTAFPTLVIAAPGADPKVQEGYVGRSALMQWLTQSGANTLDVKVRP
jgi:uncharacterized protein YyaL (SSP411 family)